MGMPRLWWSRTLDLILRGRRDRRLSAEIQAHLDLLTDEHVARGMSPADARLAARRDFGGVDQIAAAYRDQRGVPSVDGLLQDLRFALRLIVKDRWFTAATVTALALGLAVTSTIATIVYGMNLRALPFPQPSALMSVGAERVRVHGSAIPFTVFEAWRSTSHSFTGMGAHAMGVASLRDDTHVADQLATGFLGHTVLDVLGVQPIAGRAFTAEDDRAGAPGVVMLGHAVWTERYGGRPAAIGALVHVNGAPATIIGVMPPGFRFPGFADMFLPLSMSPVMQAPDASGHPVRIVARLLNGVTPQQARAELQSMADADETMTTDNRTRRVSVLGLNESMAGSVTDPAPLILLTASAVVLLIACAHAANLLLARASSRAREMALRAAVGASRARIVRQLLVESALTAAMAGLAGVALASFGVRWFAAETTDFGMPYWMHFTFDATLFAWFALVSLGTGVVFGIVPALHVSRADLNHVLAASGRSAGAGRRSRRTTAVLLVGELALTVVLLSAAGLLVKSADALYRADETVEMSTLWEFRVSLPQPAYAAAARRDAFYARLDDHLARTSGFASAALASVAPFGGAEERGVLIEGAATDPSRARPAMVVAIGPRYFDTIGLALRRGRDFDDLDEGSRRDAALVNERFVDVFLAGQDPIGRRVRLVSDGGPEHWVTIAGVAPPIRQAVASGVRPVVYVPHQVERRAAAAIILRGDPNRFAAPLREAVRAIDPDLPLWGLQSMERLSQKSRWMQRSFSTVFGIFAVIAVVLSALGVYAMLAYTVSQQAQEIGVRRALGATAGHVTWLLLRGTLIQLTIGLTIGIAGAAGVGTLLQGMLVDTRGADPITLGSVCLLLAAVAVTASLLPAWRATRVDPLATIRHD